MRTLVSTLLIAFGLSFAALSQDAPGWDAYVRGDLAAARATAQQAANEKPSADSYALACRAGLAIGGFLETGEAAVESLHQSLKDCEKALELDPNHYVAALSHAIAIGFEGLRLRKAAYARASRREIETFIELYPQNALARGSLAGWHAAVAQEGWLARLFLGASRARAKSLYAEALVLPNLEAPLTYEYIRFLVGGTAADREKASSLASQMLATAPSDGFEAILHTRLETLLLALKSNNEERIEQSVADATPFNGIDDWGKPDAVAKPAYPLWEPETSR